MDTTDYLCRLDRFYWALDKKNLDQSLASIQKVFNYALQQIENSQEFSVIHQKLSKSWLLRQYQSDLSAMHSNSDISNYIHQFLKLLESISNVPPLLKSFRGHRGTVLLARFRKDKNSESFVVKGTDPYELDCSRIYSILSHCPSRNQKGSHNHGFYVPQVAGIDLTFQEHEQPDGHREPISASMTEKIQKQLGELIYRNVPNHNQIPDYKYWMLSERIPGANLYDFFRLQYKELFKNSTSKMEEKLTFFSHFGHIAFVDMIVGNLDRLVALELDSEHENVFSLIDAPTNLGNALVEKTEQDYKIFLIDNGICPALISLPNANTNYNIFLKDLLSKPDFALILAKNMLASMVQAIQQQIKNEKNPNEYRKQFAPFLTDLKEYGPEGFVFGITEMAQHFSSIPFELHPLFDKIKEKHPSLISIVQERIQLFKSLRHHHE